MFLPAVIGVYNGSLNMKAKRNVNLIPLFIISAKLFLKARTYIFKFITKLLLQPTYI